MNRAAKILIVPSAVIKEASALAPIDKPIKRFVIKLMSALVVPSGKGMLARKSADDNNVRSVKKQLQNPDAMSGSARLTSAKSPQWSCRYYVYCELVPFLFLSIWR